MQSKKTAPIVLSIAGHDPCGGAGIQADIEAIAAGGGRAATVISCLTIQDTSNVYGVAPTPVELMEQQANSVLSDLPVAVIKIGLLGSAETAAHVAALIQDHPSIPVVLDPVLAAGGGSELASQDLIRVLRTQIMPRVLLATPNSVEARRLTGEENLEQAAQQLLDLGCKNVLLTGTHEPGGNVVNRLYSSDCETVSWRWPRLEGEYHGSGCTLASAVAVRLARGLSMRQAVERAQRYTWEALSEAERPGRGQALPTRLHPCPDKR